MPRAFWKLGRDLPPGERDMTGDVCMVRDPIQDGLSSSCGSEALEYRRLGPVAWVLREMRRSAQGAAPDGFRRASWCALGTAHKR